LTTTLDRVARGFAAERARKLRKTRAHHPPSVATSIDLQHPHTRVFALSRHRLRCRGGHSNRMLNVQPARARPERHPRYLPPSVVAIGVPNRTRAPPWTSNIQTHERDEIHLKKINFTRAHFPFVSMRTRRFRARALERPRSRIA